MYGDVFYRILNDVLLIFSTTTIILTLSLHDALPIYRCRRQRQFQHDERTRHRADRVPGDRKSTRLNSSHRCTSYAVFCLKKKTPREKHARDDTASYLPVNSYHLFTMENTHALG